MNRINRKMYLDKIIQVMKNDYPLIKNLKDYGFYDQFSKKELNYVLSGIFEKPIKKSGEYIYNKNGDEIYGEYYDGYWFKREYDENGYRIYYENSGGKWEKSEYDENGNMIYYETSDGIWKNLVTDFLEKINL